MTPSAVLTPRSIGFALFVVAASLAGVTVSRHRPSRTETSHARFTQSPAPMPPSGVPVYQPTVRFNRGRIYPNRGVVRDSSVSVRSLWRRTGETWVPQPSTHPAMVLRPNQERPATDLVGGDLTDGLYAAELDINGRVECRLFALPEEPVECGTHLAIIEASNPLRPPTDCHGEGFLAEMRPADGNGVTTRFLEDGRIREQVPMREGRADGVAIEYYREFDGAPTHFERTFVRGEMTLSRYFDLAGHQLNELPYANGRPHGTFHSWNALGQLTEETAWNHGALVSMHSLDGHGRVVSGVEYGMPGRDHGTYCRPDHHCSQW